jgi:hypothetical protein
VAIEQEGEGDTPLPLDPSFRKFSDAPPHLQLFERAAGARDQAMLEVVLEGRGVVLATVAEADAVLRVVRSGRDVDRLDPPARGLASWVGRVRGPLAAGSSSGSFSRVAEGLTKHGGSLEGGDAIHIEADLVYTSPERAEQDAAAARDVLDRLSRAPEPLRSLPNSVNLAPAGDTLRIHATVPFAVVAHLH